MESETDLRQKFSKRVVNSRAATEEVVVADSSINRSVSSLAIACKMSEETWQEVCELVHILDINDTYVASVGNRSQGDVNVYL